MTGRARRAAGALAVLVLVAGCGVPVEDAAEPLPSGALPSASSATQASPAASGIDVYFAAGRMLQAVEESLSDRTPAGAMAALAAGPPPDRAEDLRTLLVDPSTGMPVLTIESVSPTGDGVLQSTEAFLRVPVPDQVLLMGQVVSTLAEVGVRSVEVRDPAGNTLSLALPGGVDNDGPVTAKDFASLVGP